MINALYVFDLADDVQVGFEWRTEASVSDASSANNKAGGASSAQAQTQTPAKQAVQTSAQTTTSGLITLKSSSTELPPVAGARLGPLIKVVQKFSREIHGGGLYTIVFRDPIKNFENRISSNGVNSLEWAQSSGYYVTCRFLDRTCVAVQATDFCDDPDELMEEFSDAVFSRLEEGVAVDGLRGDETFLGRWKEMKEKFELETVDENTPA